MLRGSLLWERFFDSIVKEQVGMLKNRLINRRKLIETNNCQAERKKKNNYIYVYLKESRAGDKKQLFRSELTGDQQAFAPSFLIASATSSTEISM